MLTASSPAPPIVSPNAKKLVLVPKLAARLHARKLYNCETEAEKIVFVDQFVVPILYQPPSEPLVSQVFDAAFLKYIAAIFLDVYTRETKTSYADERTLDEETYRLLSVFSVECDGALVPDTDIIKNARALQKRDHKCASILTNLIVVSIGAKKSY